MMAWLKKQAVKWSGTLAGAAVGVLVSIGLDLPADFQAELALVITGLLMAVFTKAFDWIIGLLPISLDADPTP